MARPELEELYRILIESRFDFVPAGEVHLRDIYKIVKERSAELCDDSYLCSENCKSGYTSPEWKHTVRTALDQMKKHGQFVSNGSTRGMWLFGDSASSPTALSEFEAMEGRILLRLHRIKERKPRMIRHKKQVVLAATGRLICEVCDFDFVSFYGKQLGEGFAECHHRIPLAELVEESLTRLEDLAIVCANCHRMLHRSQPMVSVEQLRSLVLTRRLDRSHA